MIVTACAAACTYATLSAAVQHASPGTTIIVRGSHHGDVIVDRSVTLRGEGGASVTGGSSGIIVRAPHVRIEGLTLRGFGADDRSGQHAAIVVHAPDSQVRGNRFEENTFAITVERAPRARIVQNAVVGLGDSDSTGDSIRVWYSPGAVITGNTIEAGRDILISYSNGSAIEGNTISRSRYGLHDMFSDGMRVRNNVFEENEIGANFMYAKNLEISGNTFRANHGATGYGIGLEDVDASTVTANRLFENHVAINSVDSPSDASEPDRITSNLFTHNGSALSLQSDPHALQVNGNAFVDNLEDVEVSGGGTAAGVVWTQRGLGNYWSAYAGYDRDANGIGDIAYAPQGAFDALTDTHPELQMFRYSPAAVAVEFAERALPATASQPKFTDVAPLLNVDGPLVTGTKRRANPFTALLAMLAVVPLAVLRRARSLHTHSRRTTAREEHGDLAIEAVGVQKLYARNRGVLDVTLSVRRGESVALWGANGAGKTTLFRSILGERIDAGELKVLGHVPSPDEARCRSSIGYAPQHLPDFDASVGEMAELVAALRGVGSNEVDRVLALVHLSAERSRFVNELSGGMRQRLSVALALIGDPPLLLLDEPTAGLDRDSRETVIALIKGERDRGKTLLVTSHLLEDVCALADRVVTLDEGVSIESTPTQAFAAQYLRNIS